MKKQPFVVGGAFALVAVTLWGAAIPVSAAVISVASQSAGPGGSVDVCVSLDQSGNRVAGVEMLLRWDGGCATAVPTEGSGAQCAANPGTRKTLSTAIGTRPCGSDPNCLKALLVSFSDAKPIPDGELFCCSFLIPDAPTRSSCPLTLANVIGSDPRGVRISDIQIENGTIAISGGGAARQAAPAAGAFVPPAAVVPGAGGSGGAGAVGAAPGVQGVPAGRAGMVTGASPWVQGGSTTAPGGSRESVVQPLEPAPDSRGEAAQAASPTAPAVGATPTARLKATPATTPAATTTKAAVGLTATPAAAATPSPAPKSAR